MAVNMSGWSKARQLYFCWYMGGCGYSEESAERESAGYENNSTWRKFAEMVEKEGIFAGGDGKARPWVPDRFDPKKVYEATQGIARTPK